MALGERGRNPFLPRSTAEAAAALRAAGALEPDRAVRCPDKLAGRFLGGFNVTTLAKRPRTRTVFVALVERKVPGAYAYEVARAKVLDEIILAELEAGLDELVLLGAGLDSRPYRLADRLQGIEVFEVDHPASQATKRARLGRVVGITSPRVHFVPVDFALDDVGTALARAGHDQGAATLFVCSGVTPYLPTPAVEALLGWIAGHRSALTSVAFDAMWASVLDGNSPLFGARELCNAVKDVGEPLRWGFPDGQVEETLARMGLRAERILDADALAAYVARADGSLLARPYGFSLLVHARPT